MPLVKPDWLQTICGEEYLPSGFLKEFDPNKPTIFLIPDVMQDGSIFNGLLDLIEQDQYNICVINHLPDPKKMTEFDCEKVTEKIKRVIVAYCEKSQQDYRIIGAGLAAAWCAELIHTDTVERKPVGTVLCSPYLSTSNETEMFIRMDSLFGLKKLNIKGLMDWYSDMRGFKTNFNDGKFYFAKAATDDHQWVPIDVLHNEYLYLTSLRKSLNISNWLVFDLFNQRSSFDRLKINMRLALLRNPRNHLKLEVNELCGRDHVKHFLSRLVKAECISSHLCPYPRKDPDGTALTDTVAAQHERQCCEALQHVGLELTETAKLCLNTQRALA